MSKSPSLTPLDPIALSDDLADLLNGATAVPLLNRRQAVRIPKSLVLYVQPLNQDFEPVGTAFKAVTRDVSKTGLGFTHDKPFPASFVRIGLTPQSSTQAIAQVCYNKAFFGDKLIYLVGVKFISAKLDLT